MHILLATDNPLYPSAYGTQAALLSPLIQQFGHQVTIFSHMNRGLPITVNGVRVVGSIDVGGYNPAVLMRMHADRLKADVVITLKDPYVYDPNEMKRLSVPWIAICPVDTEPLSDANKHVLSHASAVVAVSRNGAKSLAAAEFEPVYIPHAFDTKVFDIQPREEARMRLGVPEDVFVGLFVGDNRTLPSRKNIENIIAAWAVFLARHPSSIMILHTFMAPDRGGIDVEALLSEYRIPKSSFFISDQYQLVFGFPPGYMATLYNAADVLVLPSTGEGFGLPIVEAQLCGTPVITTDWTAMRELTYFGTKIRTSSDVTMPCPTGQLELSPIGGWRFRANIASIVGALEAAYANRPTGLHREVGRKSVLPYGVDRVMRKYWKPSLDYFERLLVTGDATALVEG